MGFRKLSMRSVRRSASSREDSEISCAGIRARATQPEIIQIVRRDRRAAVAGKAAPTCATHARMRHKRWRRSCAREEAVIVRATGVQQSHSLQSVVGKAVQVIIGTHEYPSKNRPRSRPNKHKKATAKRGPKQLGTMATKGKNCNGANERAPRSVKRAKASTRKKPEASNNVRAQEQAAERQVRPEPCVQLSVCVVPLRSLGGPSGREAAVRAHNKLKRKRMIVEEKEKPKRACGGKM